jgi:hypothetical protein
MITEENRGDRRADVFSRLPWVVAAVLGFSGCHPTDDPSLVIATTWPPHLRMPLESAFHRQSGDSRPITWLVVGPGERVSSVIDRRGGVDLILGGSIADVGRLAESGRLAPLDPSSPVLWRVVHRPDFETPGETSKDPEVSRRPPPDPRDDPATLSLARAHLEAEGWPGGYEGLVRRAARDRPADDRIKGHSREALGRPAGGRSPDRARRFLAILESSGLVEPPPADPAVEAIAEGLLADLLGAALVDAREELRDADAALRRFGHPARAEAALGERPPWPPASVAKLQSSPNGGPLLDTLLEQVAPDPGAHAWLRESWSRPRRAVDGVLLAELAGAGEGRLAREPRFRAWLRGEWTAWHRQLYRRVARLAGGYVPS